MSTVEEIPQLSPPLLRLLSDRVGADSVKAVSLMPQESCFVLLSAAIAHADTDVACEALNYCCAVFNFSPRAATTFVDDKKLSDELLRFITNVATPTKARMAAVHCATAVALKARAGWPRLWFEVCGALNDVTTDAGVAIALLAVVKEGAHLVGTTLRASLGSLLTGTVACIQRLKVHEDLAQVACATLPFLIFCAGRKDWGLAEKSGAIPSLMLAMEQDSQALSAEALCRLQGLADERPNVVAPHATALLEKTLSMLRRGDRLTHEMRADALGIIVGLAKGDPAAMKKRSAFLSSFVDVVVGIIGQSPEPTDEWANVPEYEHVTVPEVDAAATALGEVCEAVQGKVIGPVVATHINANLESRDWHLRAAALTALLHSARGCRTTYVRSLPSLLREKVLPRFTDDSVAVRYAALRCAACLMEFADTPESKLAICFVLPALCGVAQREAARLRALALNTIRVFGQAISNDADDDDEPGSGPFAAVAAECIPGLVNCVVNASEIRQRGLALQPLNELIEVAGDNALSDAVIALYENLLADATATGGLRLLAMRCASQIVHALSPAARTLLLDRLVESQRIAADDATGRTSLLVADAWRTLASRSKDLVKARAGDALPWLIGLASAADTQRVAAQAKQDAPPSTEHVTTTVEVLQGVRYFVSLDERVRSAKILSIGALIAWLNTGPECVAPYFDAMIDAAVPLLTRKDVDDFPLVASDLLAAVATSLISLGDVRRQQSFLSTVQEPFATAMDDLRFVGNGYVVLMRRLAEMATKKEDLVPRLVPMACEVTYLYLLVAVENEDDGDDLADDDELEARPVETQFPLLLDMVGAIMRLSVDAKAHFVAKLMPWGRRLVEQPRTTSMERAMGLLILKAFVVHAPTEAPPELPWIAEACVQNAAQDRVPRVAELAFEVCSLITPFIASAATASAESRDAGTKYATALLTAAGNRLQQAAEFPLSPSYTKQIVHCVKSVRASFPSVLAAAPESAAQLEALMRPYVDAE